MCCRALCSSRSERRVKKSNLKKVQSGRGQDLSFASPKADPEIKTRVQVDHLGGDPRQLSENVRGVRKEKERSPSRHSNEQAAFGGEQGSLPLGIL